MKSLQPEYSSLRSGTFLSHGTLFLTQATTARRAMLLACVYANCRRGWILTKNAISALAYLLIKSNAVSSKQIWADKADKHTNRPLGGTPFKSWRIWRNHDRHSLPLTGFVRSGFRFRESNRGFIRLTREKANIFFWEGEYKGVFIYRIKCRVAENQFSISGTFDFKSVEFWNVYSTGRRTDWTVRFSGGGKGKEREHAPGWGGVNLLQTDLERSGKANFHMVWWFGESFSRKEKETNKEKQNPLKVLPLNLLFCSANLFTVSDILQKLHGSGYKQ